MCSVIVFIMNVMFRLMEFFGSEIKVSFVCKYIKNCTETNINIT